MLLNFLEINLFFFRSKGNSCNESCRQYFKLEELLGKKPIIHTVGSYWINRKNFKQQNQLK